MKKVLIGGLVVLTLGFFAVTFGKINMYNANKVNSNDKNNSKIIEVSDSSKSNKIDDCIKKHEYINHITNDLKGKIDYDDKTDELKIEVKVQDIRNNVNDKTKNENIGEGFKESSVDYEKELLVQSKENIKEYIKDETGIDVKVNVSIIE